MSNEIGMLEDTFTLGDITLSLEDLAGTDMDQVSEFRFEGTPEGIFLMRYLKGEITAVGEKENRKPVVRFELEIREIQELADKTIKIEDWLGKKHLETIWISDVVRDMGQAKALLADTGVGAEMPRGAKFQDWLDACPGHEFWCMVKHRKNPKNTDQVFVQIVRDKNKLRPVKKEIPQATQAGGAPASAQAAA